MPKTPRIIPAPEHEHDSGCWPGCEGEFDCPVIIAFQTMRRALEVLTKWDEAEGRHAADAWILARKAIKIANKAYEGE